MPSVDARHNKPRPITNAILIEADTPPDNNDFGHAPDFHPFENIEVAGLVMGLARNHAALFWGPEYHIGIGTLSNSPL